MPATRRHHPVESDDATDPIPRGAAYTHRRDVTLMGALPRNPTGTVDRLRLLPAADTLTAREREVLALLAQGLTDRGIGEHLWLTRKTVETHIRHILAKLNVPNGPQHNRRVLAAVVYLSMERDRDVASTAAGAPRRPGA